MITWKTIAFEALSNKQLYELIKLRIDVFVVEQNCPYSDLDDKDMADGVMHLLALSESDEILAYARLLPPGISYQYPSIGRVIVREDQRANGLGHELLNEAIKHCHLQWPDNTIKISAQLHLEKFYRAHGFSCCGKPYLEDGIPHVSMTFLSVNEN
ncbi:GNAT family N-acetyltransferase [Vibrio salinus]|uniref:GNAT family N-acetyltransferase n=1 Tax=Vibrio salinus TaxID=2899784 RepID=UPI001E4434B0|nr:GNAT family N-acetyltransferase [Vibrio salinus]MCE0494026.1 GNAT family N-acetyltransferase [Vibrio salinus]